MIMINVLIISFLRLDLKLLAMLLSILCKLNKIALSVLSMTKLHTYFGQITILTMLVDLHFWYKTCTNYVNLTHNLGL